MTKQLYIVNKISCIRCKSEINHCNFEKHYNGKSCIKGGTFHSLIKTRLDTIGSNCSFCAKFYDNKSGLIHHQNRCKHNPNAIPPSFGMKGKKGKNQYIKAKELGLPSPIVSLQTREKLSQSNKGRIWTDEAKANWSTIMKQVVIDNPESYSSGNQGRVKTYEIDNIKLKGLWEVDFYIWCKNNNILVDRPIQSFHYVWNGDRSYFPDFYLPKYKIYIEVKGFQTERDKCKWKYFPEKLSIIKDLDIKNIRSNKFSIKHIFDNIYKNQQ